MNEVLSGHLKKFGVLSDGDIAASRSFWMNRHVHKGVFFNMENMACTDHLLVIKGLVRIYHYDPKTGEDKNIYFFAENQFLGHFRSYTLNGPCTYFIEAMEDTDIITISYHDINSLYETNANWLKLGKLLAEESFKMAQARTEDFMFYSHEKRYMRLLDEHPHIVNRIPWYHISSYLGIKVPSLSRIRSRVRKMDKLKKQELSIPA
jgi:CRP-like cAMP-binding protein